MPLSISALPANHGDCFVFEDLSNHHNLVVDCGLKITFNNHLSQKVDRADTLILTHIDEDHILGSIPLIESTPERFSVSTIYFNSPSLFNFKDSCGNISVKQANQLDSLITDKGISLLGLEEGQTLVLSKDLKLEAISPRKEDLVNLINVKFDEHIEKSTNISIHKRSKSVDELCSISDSYPKISADLVNACSIAFILEYKDKKLLYLADAHPEIITDYLEKKGYNQSNRLHVDIVKLSHHGSFKSISERLISIISCDTYWISTNGGKGRAKHPAPATLAKLIKNVDRNGSEFITFLFNYPVNSIESKNGRLLNDCDLATYKVVLKEQTEVVWL